MEPLARLESRIQPRAEARLVRLAGLLVLPVDRVLELVEGNPALMKDDETRCPGCGRPAPGRVCPGCGGGAPVEPDDVGQAADPRAELVLELRRRLPGPDGDAAELVVADLASGHSARGDSRERPDGHDAGPTDDSGSTAH